MTASKRARVSTAKRDLVNIKRDLVSKRARVSTALRALGWVALGSVHGLRACVGCVRCVRAFFLFKTVLVGVE